MRAFIKHILIITFVALSIIVSVNLFINRDYIFKEGSIISTVKNSGRVIDNNGHRYLKLMMVRFKPRLDCDAVIIGSSRTIRIGKNITQKRVFNLSVPSIHLFDMKVLINEILKNNSFVQNSNLVLSIDPWIFNSNSPEKRYTYEYNRSFSEDLAKICSPSYFRKNIDITVHYLLHPALKDTIESDGSKLFLADHGCSESSMLVKSYVQNRVFATDEFADFVVDRNYIHYLESLLSKCSDFKHVVVWLQPLHPLFINNHEVGQIKKKVAQTESILADLVKKFGYQKYGSFFQESELCDFEDQRHLKSEPLSKEFDQLFLKYLN